MTRSEKVLYTARVHTTGARDAGVVRSSDGRLDVRLAAPGGSVIATNPEQLLAAAWAAGFEGAIAVVARRMKVSLPAPPVVDAEVDLCLTGNAFSLRIRLDVSLPGLDRKLAQALVDATRDICPYAKAVKGSVDVVIRLD